MPTPACALEGDAPSALPSSCCAAVASVATTTACTARKSSEPRHPLLLLLGPCRKQTLRRVCTLASSLQRACPAAAVASVATTAAYTTLQIGSTWHARLCKLPGQHSVACDVGLNRRAALYLAAAAGRCKPGASFFLTRRTGLHQRSQQVQRWAHLCDQRGAAGKPYKDLAVFL